MPPPTANDPWLTARRFGIVIDAGSSGSRLQIYSWRDARVVKSEDRPTYEFLPKVEKGTKHGDDWVMKAEPGISSFANNPGSVAAYLAPLLEHARSHVPPSMHTETPILLSATAGLRLLLPSQQDDILLAACDFIRFHSHFRLNEPSSLGPCGSSVRVISGEEEGLFGWIAVNYLMDGFLPTNNGPATYGFMDMGGASTQVAFEPSEEQRKKTNKLIDVKLRLIDGRDIEHQVFVTTWLGYGTNQARDRYVSSTISRHEISEGDRQSGRGTFDELVLDPCLPRGLKLEEPRDDPLYRNPYVLYGTGSFEQCLKDVSPLLNKEAHCADVPCPINGVHVPHIDFSVSRFIGVSEYWYSSEHVFGLGGAYDFVQFERAASEFCSREWSEILAEHERSKAEGRLGGDGEVNVDGKVVGTGRWGDLVEIPRLEMQCFKAAWIVNILHEGIGLPRIVDPRGNSTLDGDQMEQKAAEKGLGKPAFQSMDVIGDTAISWTLGQMVLEACRDIPSLSPDGLSPSHLSTHLSAAMHITDPPTSSLEDPTLHHLSPALMRFGQAFSVLGSVLYLSTFIALLFVIYRLRLQIMSCTRRNYRAKFRTSDSGAAYQWTLENGRSANGRRFAPALPHMRSTLVSGLSSSLGVLVAQLRLSRLASFFRNSPSSTQASQEGSVYRHVPSSSARMLPLRSFSSPSLKYQNDSLSVLSMGSHPKKTRLPNVTNLATSQVDLTQSSGHMNQSFYTLPRSRNNSQMNLTNLVPRQPLTRSGGNSGQQTPTGSFHDID